MPLSPSGRYAIHVGRTLLAGRKEDDPHFRYRLPQNGLNAVLSSWFVRCLLGLPTSAGRASQAFTHASRELTPVSARSPPRAPVLLQHSVARQVQPVVVDPLAVACDAFPRKPQPLGNRPAARVQRAAVDGYAVQAQIVEQVVQQVFAATRDDALAPITLLDPVADAAIPVGPVDGMAAYRTGERAVDPDAALRPPATGELLAHPDDKAPQVLDRKSVGYGKSVDP